MEPERWRRIETVFQAVQTRPPDEQSAFLAQACGDDLTLRREVESLLRAATDSRFLEPQAPHTADEASAVSAQAGPDLLQRLQHTVGPAYRVERELGGGGMARIFVATDTTLGRQVVFKVLAPGVAAGVNANRFHREVRLAASLRSATFHREWVSGWHATVDATGTASQVRGAVVAIAAGLHRKGIHHVEKTAASARGDYGVQYGRRQRQPVRAQGAATPVQHPPLGSALPE